MGPTRQECLRVARRFYLLVPVAFLVTLAFSGCGPAIPPAVSVSGVVSINGEPVTHAQVRFYPMQEGLDGNFVASGVTDDEGKFTLSMAGGQIEGACACENRVTVSEGPMPDELREKGQAAVILIMKFRKGLKNRPIPRRYSALGDTPLTFVVDPEQTTYDLELKR